MSLRKATPRLINVDIKLISVIRQIFVAKLMPEFAKFSYLLFIDE